MDTKTTMTFLEKALGDSTTPINVEDLYGELNINPYKKPDPTASRKDIRQAGRGHEYSKNPV